MQKINFSSVIIVVSIVLCVVAILAEVTLFNTLKHTKAEIDASVELWGRVEFAYWAGAFSEGGLFSMTIIALAPSVKIGKASRIFMISLFCVALIMTISVRDVLWTF